MSEESIYNLIPQQVTQLQKGTMHKSKFPGNIPPTFSTFGAGRVSQINVANIAGAYAEQPRNHEHISLGATFGKTKEHDPQPKSFLTRQLRPELPERKRQYLFGIVLLQSVLSVFSPDSLHAFASLYVRIMCKYLHVHIFNMHTSMNV
jgi:hypothetical protein